MKNRGGGIVDIRLKDLSNRMDGYYQLGVTFDTADSMGANLINSCLESMTAYFKQQAESRLKSGQMEVIMSILSNYTPECLVECEVNTSVEGLDGLFGNMSGPEFAKKFVTAVSLSGIDIYRAVTHNKGIFNGMDAVILATGNDFRATEACGHAYASRDGMYKGLSAASIIHNEFVFRLEIPMAVGTVGGLTRLHPMASTALDILGNPNAAELMTIIAAAGLASNFSAIRALITTGIQTGHMRLHLINILNQLGANSNEKNKALEHFKNTTITNVAVSEFLKKIRAGAI
jgi:hydroxymethylglutaryl-CoA reductase